MKDYVQLEDLLERSKKIDYPVFGIGKDINNGIIVSWYVCRVPKKINKKVAEAIVSSINNLKLDDFLNVHNEKKEVFEEKYISHIKDPFFRIEYEKDKMILATYTRESNSEWLSLEKSERIADIVKANSIRKKSKEKYSAGKVFRKAYRKPIIRPKVR